MRGGAEQEPSDRAEGSFGVFEPKWVGMYGGLYFSPDWWWSQFPT